MKTQPEIKSLSSKQINWDLVAAILCLFAIPIHFILRWAGAAEVITNIPLFLAIAISGIPVFLPIARKAFAGDFGSDLLGVVAFVTGALLGEYLAAVLIILMLSGGQVLESYAVRKASSVLRTLAERMPSTAHRRKGDKLDEINLNEIAIGDEVVIFPHEVAPVDGVVIDGNGSMDESYLTGEPYFVSKAPGVAVLSGSINGEVALTIRAEKLPTDSRYAQIMAVMQDAEQKRPTARRLGDQIGAIFTPVALVFGLAAWFFSGDSMRFLAVLVVATPCPLLIAIPVTIISAISMAAKMGIIIKDPTVLERLPTCRTAIFDKTGTLTYGKPVLTEIFPAPGISKEDVLQWTASLERYSKHPLSGAILNAAEQAQLPLVKAKSVSERPGQGLIGQLDGDEIRITHRKKLVGTLENVAALLPPTSAGLECVILRNGMYAATFRFLDAPRADGQSFISHLAPIHQFRKIILLSGDRASEVEYLAKTLGIKNALASQSPEQKVAVVRAETAKSPTLFMGDGINDAPALASATVGIAFGQYSNATAEAAGAVILDSTLVKVDELLHISIAMRRILLQSVIGGMALSIIAMGFAAWGFIPPVKGALLQEGIDVLAILNSLRLTFKRKIESDLTA
jgi:heavy metal translocating P-type ATPase